MSDENTMSLNWTGEERTPDEMLGEFKLYGLAKRVDMLNQIDDEFNRMNVDDSPAALRKFSEFSDFRRDMKSMHHRLRKAGR
jgi:hypothetical protein